MGEVASVQIPEKVISEIVKAEISTAMLRATAGHDALITKIVQGALMLKVNERGEPCTYSSSVPFIEHCLAQTIRQAAKDAIIAYVESSKKKIEKAVQAELKKSNGAMVRSFMAAILKSTESSYNLHIEVKR